MSQNIHCATYNLLHTSHTILSRLLLICLLALVAFRRCSTVVCPSMLFCYVDMISVLFASLIKIFRN